MGFIGKKEVQGLSLFLLGLRSLLFYFGYILSAILFTPFALCTALAPYSFRTWFISRWCWFALFWLRLTCGIRVKVTCHYDVQSLPASLVLSNHQSTWEALFLQLLFRPATTVVKKELLLIPFFGWGLRLLEPISIDRKKPRLAGKYFLQQGEAALKKNRWVVLFPEGTRVAVGDSKPLSLGGFRLACAVGEPIIPVYHNAGEYWPPRSLIKYPGTIECVIGDPLQPTDKPQHLLELYESQLKSMESDAYGK